MKADGYDGTWTDDSTYDQYVHFRLSINPDGKMILKVSDNTPMTRATEEKSQLALTRVLFLCTK